LRTSPRNELLGVDVVFGEYAGDVDCVTNNGQFGETIEDGFDGADRVDGTVREELDFVGHGSAIDGAEEHIDGEDVGADFRDADVEGEGVPVLVVISDGTTNAFCSVVTYHSS
jgi:hypothetical protein